MSSVVAVRREAPLSHIARLPDELLSYVLAFSGNLSVGRVCRRWSRPDFIRACYRAILESYSQRERIRVLMPSTSRIRSLAGSLFFLRRRVAQTYANVMSIIEPEHIAPHARQIVAVLRERGLRAPPVIVLEQALQVEEDANLLLFFHRLSQQYDFGVDDPVLTGTLSEKAAAIREWMVAHQDLLEQITELDINGWGLTTLPSELSYFRNLEWISLAHE